MFSDPKGSESLRLLLLLPLGHAALLDSLNDLLDGFVQIVRELPAPFILLPDRLLQQAIFFRLRLCAASLVFLLLVVVLVGLSVHQRTKNVVSLRLLGAAASTGSALPLPPAAILVLVLLVVFVLVLLFLLLIILLFVPVLLLPRLLFFLFAILQAGRLLRPAFDARRLVV